ncbi:hypothetical protein N1851_025785 [Merluccius polli]|uniref:Uncharacterized protein n=1 Tax=Merluccius polli TaxID=89951 RepID=A0AA47NVU7_MERPO|nr:hypothetical protein N1851_025785 [Merluccius polli]
MEEMKKKKADIKKVNEMMVSTFSLRQKQIVEEPPVAEVKTKWPALFTDKQRLKLANCGWDGQSQRMRRTLPAALAVQVPDGRQPSPGDPPHRPDHSLQSSAPEDSTAAAPSCEAPSQDTLL